MATTQEKWQEIANRGLQDNFDPQTRAKFDEAVSRGLITMQDTAVIPAEETTIGDNILGGIETARNIAGAVISEPLSGLAGIGAAGLNLIPGVDVGDPGDVTREFQRAASEFIAPETQAGQSQLGAIGSALEPVSEALGAVESTLGESVLAATGSPELAAIAHTLPTAALEALGVGAFKGAARVPEIAKQGLAAAEGAVESLPQRQPITAGGKAKQRIAELINQGSADVETAKFSIPSPSGERGIFGKLGEKMRIGAPDVVKDVNATEAINQGFDEGVIAAVKASSPQDQAKMLEMVNIKQKGNKNKLAAMRNRPTDVVGNSLMDRVRVIQSANRRAGKELEGVANSLKGEAVDFSPAVNSFMDNLEGMGVSIGDDLKPNFAGSDIEGIPAAENAINNVVRRMTGKTAPDAFDVHRMKKFIDEHVTFGKSAEGLAGKTEGVLKSLRRDLDSVLDTNFPEYNRVNTDYAETIGALDALQDVAGRKMDLTGPNADKATGQLMRRVMSNAQSRVNLVDAIDQIEGVANKYVSAAPVAEIGGVKLLAESGAKSKKGFTDDLLAQVLFADELDAVFKPSARTSFENLASRQVSKAAEAATSAGRGNLVVEAAGKAAQKARGISEENAFKAIIELLRGNQ